MAKILDMHEDKVKALLEAARSDNGNGTVAEATAPSVPNKYVSQRKTVAETRPRGSTRRKIDPQALQELLDAGTSVREIAKTFEVTKASVYNACKRYGIKRQESERKAHATETAQANRTKEKPVKAPESNGAGPVKRRSTRQIIDLTQNWKPITHEDSGISAESRKRSLLDHASRQFEEATNALEAKDAIRLVGALLSIAEDQKELGDVYFKIHEYSRAEETQELRKSMLMLVNPMLEEMRLSKMLGRDPAAVRPSREIADYLLHRTTYAQRRDKEVQDLEDEMGSF